MIGFGNNLLKLNKPFISFKQNKHVKMLTTCVHNII